MKLIYFSLFVSLFTSHVASALPVQTLNMTVEERSGDPNGYSITLHLPSGFYTLPHGASEGVADQLDALKPGKYECDMKQSRSVIYELIACRVLP